jgi:hypothetical protein
MRSRVLVSLMAFGSIVLLAACGGGDDGGDSNADGGGAQGRDGQRSAQGGASGEFDGLAAQMLLTLEDLPAGLVEEASDDDTDDENPLDQCDAPGLESEVVGEAESPNFTSADRSVRLSHFVDIYTSPSSAGSPFDGVAASGACIAEVFNRGEMDTPDVSFEDFEFGMLPDPGLGDQSAAYRLSGTLVALEAGLEVPAHFDFTAARVGRVVTRLLYVTFPSTPDESLEAELMAVAVDRVESLAPGN